FHGKVARTSGALDQATRTLSTEVRVANDDARLLAGMYAEVRLKLPSERRVYELPATALLNDAAGLRIAVVGKDDKVELRRVALERDLGATVQVASGLDGGERVIQVASAELAAGQKVEPIAVPVPPASASAASAPIAPVLPSAAPSASAPAAR